MQLRVGDVPQPCLGDEPLPRAADATLLQDVVEPRRAVCPGAAPSADRYTSVRLGEVVLVELRRNVQDTQMRSWCSFCSPAGARCRKGSSGHPPSVPSQPTPGGVAVAAVSSA